MRMTDKLGLLALAVMVGCSTNSSEDDPKGSSNTGSTPNGSTQIVLSVFPPGNGENWVGGGERPSAVAFAFDRAPGSAYTLPPQVSR